MPLTALHRFGPEDLNPGEQVIYRAHLSFVAFLFRAKKGIFIFSLGIAVLLLAYYYRHFIGFLEESTITVGVLIFVAFPILIGLFHFKVKLIDWIYDEDVITNQRVIDYNQKFLFDRELSTANMKSVENVLLFQKGILRTLFDYGSLDVQTAGTSKQPRAGSLNDFLLLDDVKHPKNVQRLVDEIANRVKSGIAIDREEMLIMCGLKTGTLDEYFVIRKTKGWKKRIKKILKWS